jgi:putative membrane protein
MVKIVEFITKLIAKIVLNGGALYISRLYLSGFILAGGFESLAVGALVLAVLNAFVRPILKLISTPLIWITFGLFNIIIHILILWFADQLLTQLTITDFKTLFFASIIVAIANTFF